VNIPTGQSNEDYTFEPEDVSFRLVTGPTREQLNEISARHTSDYVDFKTGYVGWFLNVGKNPNKSIGYAENTVEQISMKILCPAARTGNRGTVLSFGSQWIGFRSGWNTRESYRRLDRRRGVGSGSQ
jgi:hypothetical protein